LREVQRYTDAADRERMARAAIKRLEGASGTIALQTFPATIQTGAIYEMISKARKTRWWAHKDSNLGPAD
jgi:hypothetical protein